VLTGESLPVSKQAEDFMASGTVVARGTPHLRVLATGPRCWTAATAYLLAGAGGPVVAAVELDRGDG
jgi:cation transport ATPase